MIPFHGRVKMVDLLSMRDIVANSWKYANFTNFKYTSNLIEIGVYLKHGSNL